MDSLLEQNRYIDFFFEYKKITTDQEKIDFICKYIISKFKEQSISAMIGAGFSINANKNFPDWANLLIDAYQEMHPNTPPKKRYEKQNDYLQRKVEHIRTIGEPNVAEEYEKFRGAREYLDFYIEERIQKVNKEKNDLSTHKALLSLNWSDIITTNWDTLLEDSRELNNYALVEEAKDLRNNNKKRIVKINGSLRNKEAIKAQNYKYDNCYDHLYLITNHDFINYNKNHEDFSNFMKVKMLENTFCLFGFSGNDWNFRYWVKELKRVMTKGGETKNPNPIFLFTLEKLDDPALMQYYRNNYIIPLNIFKLYSFINKIDCSPDIYKLSPAYIFSSVFSYFLTNSQSITNTIENDFYSVKDNNFKILSSFNKSNFNTISNDFLEKYNCIDLFAFDNLHFSSSSIFAIQSMITDVSKWNKQTFIFLYRWCLGNFYSLANLFEDSKINEIIDTFDKSKLIETDAYVFTELILKYYREQNDERKLNAYYEKLLKYPQCNNIVIYSNALKFIDNLEYESLKGLLNNWHPEKAEHPESLFIIRKISLLHMFENIRFYEDMKEEISALFKIALDNCKEEQLKLFILLFQRQYNNIFFIQPDDSSKELIKHLREKELSEPYKYLDEFETKKSSNNDIKSNESKRYTITWKLSGNDSNQDFLNSIRVLNFFEYTGLSVELFLATRKIKSLIPNMKTSDYYLSKMFVHCISYFGNDSDEDFVKLSVDKIVRYLNSETMINIYNAIYKILVYKVNHQRNARSYLFICNELSKYFNDNSSKLSKLIYSEIKKSNDSNYQIANLIRRGRVWGAKRVFEDYLLKVQDDEEYKFILEWIINEYIKDERELVKQQHYTSSEFFDYYFDLLVKNPKKDLIQEVISQFDVIKLLEEDFSYEKQLCLYGYEFLPKDLSQKTKDFFETNFTIYTDPYFITIFKSDTLKNKIISIIQDDNPLSFDSRKYQITKYIRFLNHEKMFDLNDKILISNIIKTRFEKIISNKDYFSHGFTSLKDTIADLFYCLENITSEQDRNSSLEIKNTYDLVKTEFQNQIQDFYSFEWLYTDDYQKFRISFSNAVSYFSYLHQSAQYLYIFNIILSKLIVEDNNDFEAILELFITIYSNKYENNILENNETHTLLLQLMKKYSIEIPFCYDYLFIKQQMKLLAENLKHNNINDDVIDFWISN